MIYISREKLTCYIVIDDNDKVYFSKLNSVLMERPANVVYCEKDGKLYGIISMGDIARAYRKGKDFVVINKRFTSVKENEYMHVRNIFRNNNKINALPVVNDLNELIGSYIRWDDFVIVNNLTELKENKYVIDFFAKKVALVRPCKAFVRKRQFMQRWKGNLLKAGMEILVIDAKEACDAFNFADYVIFTDEEEKRGIGTLYDNILNKEFNWNKSKTYAEIYDGISAEIGNKIGDQIGYGILKTILSKGVYVFTLNCVGNESNYWKLLKESISDKYLKIGEERLGNGYVYKEFRKDFFAELYSEEYSEKILNHGYSISHTDGISKLKDIDTETYKVTDGERLTLNQPLDFQRCIYFYGPCIVIGTNVADKHTIESFLQARLNVEGYRVKCVNYGNFEDQLTELNRVATTRFNKGDIAIIYIQNKKFDGIPSINLAEVCQKYKVPATWMTDDPRHSNHKLNHIYADEIFDRIKPIVRKEEEKHTIEVANDFITLGYLERYFHDFIKTHQGVNGAIVMNCNPFTLGHRYLIEQALKQVDNLIVFVVEEDKSAFTFKERYLMVIEGTKDLKNVIVVPSGNFILSQTTFPEYFLKIEDKDIIHNVEYDITLFAEQIAPKLNITYRFVGEELEDRVTNIYNEAMKRILPKHGINIVEILRARINGKIISASLVRKRLDNREKILELVPQTTWEIIYMENY